MFERLRIANPHRKTKKRRASSSARPKFKRTARPAVRRRKNTGLGEVLTIMSNPKKRRKKNPFKSAAKKARRRNPMFKAKRRSMHRRRNPFAVAGHNPTSMLKLGLGVAGGGIGTRAVTNLILQKKNQGLFGYSANIAIALLLGWGGAKFLGAEVGTGLMAGGLGSTAQRIWDEKVAQLISPATGAPATVSGMGDISYSDDGMGLYANADFPTTRINGPYVPALPPAPTAPATPAASKPSQYAAAW